MSKLKVGVIFGGASVEHEISVISALQAISNINTDKESIYSNKIVKKYIELFEEDKSPEELINLFDMNNEDNLYVYNKIINVLNKLVFIEEKDLRIQDQIILIIKMK